ncbi:hypothetical protein HVX06_22170 (plasmid) [Enterobacter sp. RHB15-C17]|nr:hypothetical protein HVX06_22170 [Enterobacter sp. RHB15-C17]
MPTYSVSNIISDKTTLPADGSLTATLSATIIDDAAAAAPDGTPVTWAATGAGAVDNTTSTTSAGVATALLTANDSGDGTINITATTADDLIGKTAHVSVFEPLAAPVVNGATTDDQFTLDYYDLQIGVELSIPHYSGAAANDTVTFFWGEAYSNSKVLTDPNSELPWVINVTEDCPPACLADGEYQVYYTARDVAGNATDSSYLNLKVSDGGETAPTLAKPEVPVANDGYINIDDTTQGVTVTASYASMVAGDVITLYWTAMDVDGNQIDAASTVTPAYTVVDGETSHDWDMPYDMFYPDGIGFEGSFEAYYTVMVAGETALELSHSTTGQIDTVPPGKNC